MSTTSVTSSKPPSMSDPAAAKTRIITHMNADHADSLTRYLEHYANLPSYSARHARLTDVSLAWLLLSSAPTPWFASSPRQPHHSKREASTTHFIPLDPPLTSFAACRQRFVEMDAECRERLGRSEVTVKQYVPAKGFHMVVAVVCLVTYALMGYRGNFEGKGWVGDAFGLRQRLPGLWKWLWGIQPWVIWPMVAIHLGEACYMDQTRLRKHSVPRLSALWWKWMVSTFVEGYGNFVRLDALVQRERRKKEKAAH